MPATRRRSLIQLLGLLALTTAAATGLAQGGDDPRNWSEDYWDAIDGALCMTHHETQGFRPVQIVIMQRYSQLPIGEVVPIDVRLRNPWLHSVLDLSVTVNTTLAPGLDVVTGDLPEAVERDGISFGPIPPGPAQAFEELLEVQENATEIRVYAELVDPEQTVAGAVGQDPPKVHLEVEKRLTDAQESTGRAVVAFDEEDIKRLGFGNYKVRAWPVSDIQEDYELRLGMFVYYNRSSPQTYTFTASSDVGLHNGETHTFTIPVIKHTEEEAIIDLAAHVRTHWPHLAGTNAADNGHFMRFTTMRVTGGDELVLASNAAGPQLTGVQVDLMNSFTRSIGFLAMLLVPMAMVTGGLFGRSSRRWLNDLTGGAKKRILWHGAMSWLILATATIHLVLALLEKQMHWDKGLLWGGVGWLLLVSLGITGYYQVRMIKRWSYKAWRHIHLATAIGVFAFGLLHAFIDGSDLAPVRETLTFLNRLAWP